jgi:hypothetical protein
MYSNKMINFKLINPVKSIKFTEAKKYTITIISGYKIIKKGNFKISLINKTTGEHIEIKERRFKITTCWGNKRAIKYYEFLIPQEAEYNLLLENIDDLKLNKSNLIISSLIFPRIIKLENIEIGIE